MNNATENLEMIKEFSTNGVDAMRALGELNLRTWEKFAEQQMSTIGLMMETGLRQMKLSTETQEVSELINGQMELGRELREQLLAKGKETMEMSTEAGNAYRSWLEEGATSFAQNVKKAAGKAA